MMNQRTGSRQKRLSESSRTLKKQSGLQSKEGHKGESKVEGGRAKCCRGSLRKPVCGPVGPFAKRSSCCRVSFVDRGVMLVVGALRRCPFVAWVFSHRLDLTLAAYLQLDLILGQGLWRSRIGLRIGLPVLLPPFYTSLIAFHRRHCATG